LTRAALAGVALLAFAACAACGGAKPAAGPPVGLSHQDGAGGPATALSDKPVAYAFDSLDERPVSSEAMAGKVTVLAFVTTGSIDAQAQLGYLVAMAVHDGARVNYAAVALHPRREMPLVDALARTVRATFPFALGEATLLTGPASPFGEVVAVPTIVVLDAGGRLAWKRTGLAKADEIRAHMPRGPRP
jgi:hypothetical protein